MISLYILITSIVLFLVFLILTIRAIKKAKNIKDVKCPECGNELNTKDKTCSKCGCPIKRNKKTKFYIFVSIILLIISISFSIIILDNYSKENYIANQTNERDSSLAQIEIITDYINIRENKNTNSSIIGKVYKGEIYTIISEDKESYYNWYEIQTSNNLKGFIAGKNNDVDYVKRLEFDNDNVDNNNEENNNNNEEQKPNENNQNNNTKPNNNTSENKPNNNSNNKPNNNATNTKPNNNNSNNNSNNNNNTSTENTNTNNNQTTPTPPNENNNNEQDKLKSEYLKEVQTENSRYEKEVKSVKEEYDLFEKQAKDKMADAKYFASFFGGLYYGSERDYQTEYQRLMKNGRYDEADILAGKWQHTQEYRKWEEYLRGLPQEEQYYLQRKQEEHEKILNELKQKYNQ